MVFSDQSFLFFFLPLALILGIGSIRAAFPYVILFASLVFFGWSSDLLVLLLVGSILLNYVGGLTIERRRSRRVLLAVIAANLIVLGYFKYTYFTLGIFDFFGSATLRELSAEIALPIGISFFTFQGISYVIDVWRGDVEAERNPIRYAAYTAFFPQLIAGPIVRYRDVRDDFRHPSKSVDLFAAGAARFMLGLAKKVLIADNVAPIVDAVFAQSDPGFAGAWLGTIAYAVQIYFDFSGYSDMALGLGLMFGIRFQENFDHPYASATITEFWRRWHISLSSWFRDYLYIPLGGNRAARGRTYFNLLIVFLATGLWHGAAWNFLLWGLWHGAFIVGERLLLGKRVATAHRGALRIVYFFPAMLFGWTLFRANDIGQFLSFSASMLRPFREGAFSLHGTAEFGPIGAVALAVGIAAALAQPFYPAAGRVVSGLREDWQGATVRAAFMLAAAVLCALSIFPQGVIPFLYFRF